MEEEDSQMLVDEGSSMQTQEQQTKVTELFGGAFRVDKMPQNYRDISDIVPIADNQEIFSDVNENNPAYSGNQLIIEILDKIDQPDSEAIQYSFKDLSEETNAKDPAIVEVKHFETPEERKALIPAIYV